MGFLRTILIIMLIYYGIRFLSRLFVPILLKRFTSKMQDRFQHQFNQQYNKQQDPLQKEGKVTIENIKNSTQQKSDNVGDYVDFEEVEEK